MNPQPEKVSVLAQRMRAAGASVVTDDDGVPIITMPVGGKAKPQPDAGLGLGNKSAGELKAFIERIERLEEERRQIADDIKDVLGEAKSGGFDPKIIRQIVRIRRNPDEWRETSEMLDTYLHALGIV